MASTQQIIGKINPLLYAENGKELLKKYGSIDEIPADEVEPKNITEHSLSYESPSETLEPVYFFILDLMGDFKLNAEKLVDNFSSTPGSGHFSELMGKATAMQQQGSKILADIGIIMRGVLQVLYDLKDFKIRLQSYDDLKSKDKNTSDAARHSLKQIWLDKVDITKGNSSISMMARQLGFETIFDAFLVAKDSKDADKIDLNDRVKRVVKSRIEEFNIWVNESEKELRKRYSLERSYLKSQVNSLKLYSRWAKPYLKAAQQLEMKEHGREPALVKTFNTILLELTLLGKSKIDVKNAILQEDLPQDLKKLKIRRDYFSCILISFKFRGIPQRAGPQAHYAFGGKAEITFTAYALNSDEIEKLNKEMEKEDVGDVLKLIEGTTTESLGHLQEEINFFLEEKDESETKKSKEGSNPFLALIGVYNKKEKPKEDKKETKKEEKEKKLRSDDWIEKTHLRKFASTKAEETTFLLFDIYKKAHGMVSYT
tara:strand:- start:757 stop:2211 length:1455 start_codon:yes stop_codon:yes gene_type:complete